MKARPKRPKRGAKPFRLWLAPMALLLALASCMAGACGPGGQGNGGEDPARLRGLPATAEILFTSNRDTGRSRREIYAMDGQGQEVTRITTTDDDHFVLGVDASRRYVAATRGTEARKRLWLLDLETGQETPLTAAANHAEGRSFSPDGEWIVFWMILSGESQADIYKVRRDGSGLTNLTSSPAAIDFDPAWSRDGARIAFIANTGSPNRFVLKTMNADGGDVRTVHDPVDAIATERFPAGVYDPSWSPDGATILVDLPVRFTGKGENGTAGVWHTLRVRADGTGAPSDLSQAGGHADGAEYLPSYSPDGQSIVLTMRYGPEDPAGVSLHIFRTDREGGHLQQLTASSAWDEFAVWIG